MLSRVAWASFKKNFLYNFVFIILLVGVFWSITSVFANFTKEYDVTYSEEFMSSSSTWGGFDDEKRVSIKHFREIWGDEIELAFCAENFDSTIRGQENKIIQVFSPEYVKYVNFNTEDFSFKNYKQGEKLVALSKAYKRIYNIGDKVKITEGSWSYMAKVCGFFDKKAYRAHNVSLKDAIVVREFNDDEGFTPFSKVYLIGVSAEYADSKDPKLTYADVRRPSVESINYLSTHVVRSIIFGVTMLIDSLCFLLLRLPKLRLWGREKMRMGLSRRRYMMTIIIEKLMIFFIPAIPYLIISSYGTLSRSFDLWIWPRFASIGVTFICFAAIVAIEVGILSKLRLDTMQKDITEKHKRKKPKGADAL